MRKLLPVLLALVGLCGGIGVGLAVRGPAEPQIEAIEPAHDRLGGHGDDAKSSAPEYVKLSNQFIVPVLKDGKVVAMVILSLNLEVAPGSGEAIYAREPKLRDAFLQVMFDHANSGGFNGSFTDGSNLILLRKALLEMAQNVIGPQITDVLIGDIARQDS